MATAVIMQSTRMALSLFALDEVVSYPTLSKEISFGLTITFFLNVDTLPVSCAYVYEIWRYNDSKYFVQVFLVFYLLSIHFSRMK